MKKIIPLLALLLLVLTRPAAASHIVGAEITYQQVALNVYQLTYKQFRDCAGAPTGNVVALNIKAPGCNSGRDLLLNQVSRKLIKPYGPGVAVICGTPSSQSYVEVITYTGMLTFTPSEAACTDWVISWGECCRPNTGNLIGQADLYTETHLKLLPGLVNSSPAFDTLHPPVMFVNVGVPYTLSNMAIDPEGDSLVYKLVAPWSQSNQPVNFKPDPQAGTTAPGLPPNVFYNPNPLPPYSNFNLQLAQLSGGPISPVYTPEYPLPVISVNWAGPPTVPFAGAAGGMIWEAKRLFELNKRNGEFRFLISRHVPNASITSGENDYTVVVLVEEYRRLNGTVTKLGSVRREGMVKVLAVMNNNPTVLSMQANQQTIAPGYEIQLRPGTPLTLELTGSETDPNQTLTVTSNAAYVLPGASFSATTGNNPVATVNWLPTAAHVRDQPYYFQVMLRDDASPLRGVVTQTLAVRVNQSGGVTGLKETALVAGFQAIPNPFSEKMSFRFEQRLLAGSLVIYNGLGQPVDQIPVKTPGEGPLKVNWEKAGQFPAGTYVARLISETGPVQTVKFVKLR